MNHTQGVIANVASTAKAVAHVAQVQITDAAVQADIE